MKGRSDGRVLAGGKTNARRQMAGAMLHYIHDPLCGWCYAASPLANAIRAAGIAIVLHGGGLWEPATRLSEEKRDYIRRSDERIGALTRLSFGANYIDRLLSDPETVLWSEPAITAVIAAGAVVPGSDLLMLHAVQDAHYVHGRRVVDRSILVELAAGIGLERVRFIEAFNTAAAREHIAQTRGWMQAQGLRGFPTFMLERNGELTRVEHEPFYGRPEEFARSVIAMAAGV